jgi:uncharacterized protein (DUF427 family)
MTKPTESVWDYPRPPQVEPSSEHLVLQHAGVVLADTRASYRVLETSHPPTYYLPRESFADGVLQPADGATWCEWKGRAAYFDLVVGDVVLPGAAWTYPEPSSAFQVLRHHVAVYPGRLERCTVDGEVVQAQAGDFYGGWITARITGPFKGAPGTSGW